MIKSTTTKQWASRIVFLLLVLFTLPDGLSAAEPSIAEKMWGPTLAEIQKVFGGADREFADITVNDGFNTYYGRTDHLSLKDREMLTIFLLTVLGKPEELDAHLGVALRLGWKFEEIREAMILSTVAAGWPAGVSALRKLYAWAAAHKITPAPPLDFRENYRSTDWVQKGMTRGAAVYGRKVWDDYLARLQRVNPELAGITVAVFYGKLLTRPMFSEKLKELCLVAGNAALGRADELALHLKGALKTGATIPEVREVLFHVNLYAGIGATTLGAETFLSIVQ